MKSFIDILRRAEHLASFIPQNAGKIPYKIVDNVWIKADLSLRKTTDLFVEQLFLGKYIEMNRSVYGKIKSKKITPHLYKWVESENIKLLELGRNFIKGKMN